MAAPLRNNLLIYGLLVAITLAAYWRVHGLSFVTYDDRDYVTNNPRVQNGLSASNLRWAGAAIVSSNWHPVTLVSHMTDCELFGLKPAGHHLVSLFFHLANVLLLFLILRVATGMIARSGLVAALFAVHPLNVESVAWVAERKNVLSTFFLLLTVLAYIWYTRSPSWRRYTGVIALFLLGLMSKPMLVTLPFLLLLLDYWPLERWKPAWWVAGPSPNSSEAAKPIGPIQVAAPANSPLSRLVLEKVPLLILSVASSIVTYLVQKAGGALTLTTLVPFQTRLGNAALSYVTYLGKAFWPAGLAVFYPYPSYIEHWKVLLAATGLLAATVVAVAAATRAKFFACGWFWYLGTLIPVIGLVQAGPQSRADRYAYIPLIGIFIILVWSAAEFGPRLGLKKWHGLVAGACAVLALAVVTRQQVGYWQNTNALFEHAEQVTAANFVASSNLGYAYIDEGRFDDAAAQFSKVRPGDPAFGDAQENLGMISLERGNFDQAVIYLKNAILANPNSYDAYNKLGGALANTGRMDQAAACFRKVLEISPNDAPAYANLGNIAEQTGDITQAIAYYRKCTDVIASTGMSEKSESARTMAEKVHIRLAELFVRGGKIEEAEGQVSEALRLDPNSSAARESLERISNLKALRN